jgi:hypothetical protein
VAEPGAAQSLAFEKVLKHRLRIQARMVASEKLREHFEQALLAANFQAVANATDSDEMGRKHRMLLPMGRT